MKLWVKLAFKEIINNKGFSLFFILNLSLGLMGFIALDSFKQSLHDHIQGQSKSLLSADVNITAYQKLASKEIDLVEKQLGKVTAKTSQILFNSMIGSAQDSRLAEISVVNSGYPLYGELILEGLGKVGPEQAAQILQKKPTALIQKELMADLKIKTGDDVKIGQMTFTVGPALIDAPGQSFWNLAATSAIIICTKSPMTLMRQPWLQRPTRSSKKNMAPTPIFGFSLTTEPTHRCLASWVTWATI